MTLIASVIRFLHRSIVQLHTESIQEPCTAAGIGNTCWNTEEDLRSDAPTCSKEQLRPQLVCSFAHASHTEVAVRAILAKKPG